MFQCFVCLLMFWSCFFALFMGMIVSHVTISELHSFMRNSNNFTAAVLSDGICLFLLGTSRHLFPWQLPINHTYWMVLEIVSENLFYNLLAWSLILVTVDSSKPFPVVSRVPLCWWRWVIFHINKKWLCYLLGTSFSGVLSVTYLVKVLNLVLWCQIITCENVKSSLETL